MSGVSGGLVGSAENKATKPSLAGTWAELGNRKFEEEKSSIVNLKP